MRINLGLEYPYKFDRTHDISVISNYRMNDQLSFSATWTYGTGNAITMPIAQYLLTNGVDLVSILNMELKMTFAYQHITD